MKGAVQPLFDVFEIGSPGVLSPEVKKLLRGLMQAQLLAEVSGLVPRGGQLPELEPVVDLSSLLQARPESQLGKAVSDFRREVAKDLIPSLESGLKSLKKEQG